MIHAKGIEIPTIPIKQMVKLDLIYPPEDMMVRLTYEAQRDAKRPDQDKREDNWKMYSRIFKVG